MTQKLQNPHYSDCYFSDQGGLNESQYIFVEGNFPENSLAGKRRIHVGESGFGTGLNFLALLKSISSKQQEKIHITYSCIEKYPLTKKRIEELLTPYSKDLGSIYQDYLMKWDAFYSTLCPAWNRTQWEFTSMISVDFKFFNGDILDWTEEEGQENVEAWFLDGHSPDKNPEIWDLKVMNAIYRQTVPGGSFSSFTASGMVKTNLRKAGFFVKRKKGYGKKRHMILGYKPVLENSGYNE